MEKTSLLELGKIQRILLLMVCCLLSLLLFFMRLNLNTEKPLNLLARNSLEPQLALNNGQPTIIEFYADWCKVCQEMAPSIQIIKEKYVDIDIILLNVDNPKWLDLIEKYQVNGIPQLNFFDINGNQAGRLIGLKNKEDLMQFTRSLLNKEDLPSPSSLDIGRVSNLNSVSRKIENSSSPRSHG